MTGYVYLIGSRKFCWYKIGKSRTPKVRVKDLGVLLPFKVEVIALWQAENYSALECLLHLKYHDCRINGEWFSFDKDQLDHFLADMPESMDTIAEFKNITVDRGPNNTLIHIVRKLDLSPEERERRKQEAIALRKSRKLLDRKDQSA